MQTYIDLTLDNEPMASERFDAVKHIFELYSSRTVDETRSIVSITLERLPFINNLITNNEKIELPSVLEIIHENYRYNSYNKDLWLNINDEMREGNRFSLLSEGVSEYEE